MNAHITFRNLNRSTAVEQLVERRAEKLAQLADRMTRCHVIVEAPHHRHQKGNIFHVRIDAHAGGRDIVVARDASAHARHEDVFVAVQDAFNAAERQIHEYQMKRRHPKGARTAKGQPWPTEPTDSSMAPG